VRDGLQARIRTNFFEPEGELDAAKAEPDRENIFDALHYRNEAEKTCLKEAADVMIKIAAETEKTLTDQINDLPDGEGDATKAFKATVLRLITSGDTIGARRLAEAIKVARKKKEEVDRFALLRREVAEGITPSEQQLEAWQGKLTEMGIWEGLLGVTIEGLARAKRVGAGLQAVADLDTDKWRGRHIAFLDKQIEARSLAVLTREPISDPRLDKQIRRWTKEISITANKGAQMNRLLDLERALDKLPPAQRSARISAFEEYGRMRAEADRLRTEIAAAVETLVAASRSTPKAEAGPLPLSVERVSAACVAQSRQMGSNWFYGKGAIAPEFVVVLERPDGVEVGAPLNEEFCP
jgi:hypothetical protein